jgi:hypothetical protein
MSNEPCRDCGDPVDPQPQPTLTTEGKQLVDGERWNDYGDPRIAWERVARLWTVILGSHVTPRQAVLCMIGVKVVRESITAKTDNLDDIEGYTEILRRLI